MPRSSLYSALRIALTYCALGALWIVLSDRAVEFMVADYRTQAVMQTWKGWFFVAVTALLLFWLTRSALRQIEREMQKQQSLSAQLAASEMAQRHLLAALDDVVWLVDLNNGKLLFVSAAVERIYGHSVDQFMAQPELWRTSIHPDDAGIVEAKQKKLDSQSSVEVEYRIVRADGQIRWLRDRTRVLFAVDGQATSLIGIATDITEQRQHAEHIHRLSNYDSLTGLPNRMMLEGLMTAALPVAQRDGRRVGVLCLDISRLKDINDTFGHSAGDAVLREVAQRLRACAGPRDIIARLGADEFAMVLPDLTDGALAGVAGQRVLDALGVPVALAVGEVKIAASIGISLFPVDADDPETMLQHADLALHDAKHRGHGQMSFYQASMNAAVSERFALMMELQGALERGEILLHYQPQIDLTDGRVVAVEALMRWSHPQRGMVPPARFIPLAEESGAIMTLGAWALQEACRQNQAWQAAGLPPMVVAVNLSAIQFRDPGLRDVVARALAQSGLTPRWLELEVTESVIMDSAEHMLDMLARLRELGVQLSIDDFGTGYSSLAYLTRFAVNKLKIDQAFVAGALKQERDATIVGTIIQMAKALHLRVIGEGVETAAHADMLRQLGCDEAQGYLFARPLPADELVQWLEQRSAQADRA